VSALTESIVLKDQIVQTCNVSEVCRPPVAKRKIKLRCQKPFRCLDEQVPRNSFISIITRDLPMTRRGRPPLPVARHDDNADGDHRHRHEKRPQAECKAKPAAFTGWDAHVPTVTVAP